MTRILHTADLHLALEHEERWRALDAVIETARERKVDAMVVAGDLLDRDEDHEVLRPRVRERMDRLGCPVFLIPGNHDLGAYAPGQDWGRDVHLLLREPVQVARREGLRLLGVPFPGEPTSFRGLRREVEERIAPDGPQVLVLHATLIEEDQPRIQAESQEDEPGRYLPVRLGELEGLEIDYVALGHYHQHAVRFAGDLPVAYAGSPCPVGPHALGPRSVAVVELEDGAEVESVRLPVAYREKLSRWLTPFAEEEDLEELAEELEGRADELCSMEVVLRGIVAGVDESELRSRVDELEGELAGAFDDLSFGLESVGLDPDRADLFRTFRERLDRRVRAGGESGDAPDSEVRLRALELAARALTA